MREHCPDCLVCTPFLDKQWQNKAVLLCKSFQLPLSVRQMDRTGFKRSAPDDF